jgi:hypothetical protein
LQRGVHEFDRKQTMTKWRGLLLLVLLYGGWSAWETRTIHHPAGVLIAALPQQGDLPSALPTLQHPGYRITPLQSFALEARVLSVERYRFDRQAELAPIDLALGWASMSDSAVLDQIDISQGGRFYHWHVDHFPVPRREIETHSANMHIIPASAMVERVVKSVRRGHIVKLAGYLVEARRADGWIWRSSLTREDTGAGACELIWVTEIELH